MYENLELFEVIVNRIPNLMVTFYGYALEIPNICPIHHSDDTGFKTSTMISPKQLVRTLYRRIKELSRWRMLKAYLTFYTLLVT